MSSEVEVPETPNWLKELEAKREKRLKTRLGHEIGAGAPCLNCNEKCPGLDLHFWRKICKNCKCSKENHEVQDDDIYGLARFELLGHRPNKLKTKIVLPGRKDAVELDWTPTGQNETVDKYLKTVAPDLLPIKGSEAAQERKKQLLQQIPIHDIDPTLCHELTEAELKQMNEYIAHVKESSVGIGKIIQIKPAVVKNKVLVEVPSAENVILHGGSKAELLGQDLGRLKLKSENSPQDPTSDGMRDTIRAQGGVYVPKFGGVVDDVQHPARLNVRNLNYAGQLGDLELNNGGKLSNRGQLPHLVSQGYQREQSEQNALPYNLKDVRYPTYDNANSSSIDYQNNSVGCAPSDELGEKRNLPHYAETKHNLFREEQQPQKISSVKDLAYSTYCNPSDRGLINEANLTQGLNMDDMPRANVPNLKHGSLGAIGNIPQAPISNLSGHKPLPHYLPGHVGVYESSQDPLAVTIGGIKDLTYEPREIKNAQHEYNSYYEDTLPERDPHRSESTHLPVCHKCKVPFKSNDFAIEINERSNAVFHPECLRCHGCNQKLADMMYFYDKKTDNIYCGRDYAKIRGIPRCGACDELIFTREYCLTEGTTFHIKHFCCFECDMPLAGQNYVMENTQPLCLPCFERTKANSCSACGKIISPNEQGVALKDTHFHDFCFGCKMCHKSLLGAKFLFRNNNLFCSHDCFNSDSS